MNDDFLIEVRPEKPRYWPFWPFKAKPIRIVVGGFKLKVWQRKGQGQKGLALEPITVEGYISAGDQVTVTVDFRGASRLKRHT